jgi:uncharacterized membrane protein HdeD (DUF308 family)
MARRRAVACTGPVRSAPLLPAASTSSDLAAKLQRVSLLRGLAALGVSVYVVSQPGESLAALARAVSGYWIIDGLIALWVSLSGAIRTVNRAVLAIRGCVGIGTALVLFQLPLDEIFGPWRPGQLMLFILSIGPAIAAIGVQIIMTATVDLLIGLQVRRQIAGEWSVALGTAVSIVFGALLMAGFSTPPLVVDRLLGVVGVAGGLGLIAGAFGLRRAG